MTPLEQAESAMVTYQRSMQEGHPWVPGGLFINNPGLDLYILAALQGWVEAKRTAEVMKRVDLWEDPDWRPSSVAPKNLGRKTLDEHFRNRPEPMSYEEALDIALGQ